MNGARERSPKSIPVSRRNRDPGGVVAGPATGVGGGRRVRGGGFRTAKAVEPRTVASTLPPLSVAPRFPDSADRQKMRTAAVCIAFVVACTSGSFVAAIRYMDPMSPQPGSNGDIGDKRMDLIEPSCDELRAMWRYTKRQSRAAKGSGYQIYHDPELVKIWQKYSDRTKAGTIYQGKFPGQARSRAAGGAPIYGKMVHKAPAGSRLRNGMRQRPRTLEDMRLFGTVNRYIPSTRQRVNFRVGGGISSPQAGSFEALKNLIQAERARELREQHIEEIVAEAALKERVAEEEEQESNMQQSRGHFSNPIPPLQIPKEYYDYNNRRYMSNVPNNGQAWSRNWLRGQYLGR